RAAPPVENTRGAAAGVARLRVEHAARDRRTALERLQPEPRRQRQHLPHAILLAGHYYVCSIRCSYTCSSLARSAEFVLRALGVEREDDALPADPVQDAPLQIRLVEPRPRRRRSWRDPSGGNRVSKTGRRGRDGLETRGGGHRFRRRGGYWLVERD